MPGEAVLSVFYSRNVLFVGLSRLVSADFFWEPWDQDVLEYSLGYSNTKTWNNVGAVVYWDAVADAVSHHGERSVHPPTQEDFAARRLRWAARLFGRIGTFSRRLGRRCV